jgi:hypothetical protein
MQVIMHVYFWGARNWDCFGKTYLLTFRKEDDSKGITEMYVNLRENITSHQGNSIPQIEDICGVKHGS